MKDSEKYYDRNNWLRRLQEGSWEPEILISGIVLYGLFQLLPLIAELDHYLEHYGLLIFSRGTVNENSTAMLTVSVIWLIIGFISHLLLRSVWAAFIGLSYVYHEGVQLHKLRLRPRFRRHLSGQLEYEPQIIRLEKICSSIFAISFLVFMNILGLLFLFMIISSLIALWLAFFPESTNFSWLNWILIPVLLIYLLDYLTLGWLKRLPYFYRVYYPLYRVLSIMTLAPLYRNIYYGIATNHKRWKVIFFLGLFTLGSIAGVIFLRGTAPRGSTVRTTPELALQLRPDLDAAGAMYHGHYRDQMGDEPSNKIWIPSARVEGQVLVAFVVHRTVEEESLIKPSCDYDSLSQVEGTNLDSLKLACLKQFYRLEIDNKKVNAEMYYLVNKHTRQDGLMSYVDMTELPRGGHVLSLHYRFYSERADTIRSVKVAELEFYKASPAAREKVN
jgi:hypothetical protein